MKVLEIMGAPAAQDSIKDMANNIPKNTDLNIFAILGWVYAATGLIAAGFIVYGAVNYVMSQGQPSKIEQASQTIVYAVIGLVVVLLASGITYLISQSV
jgi:hypothetical protein